MRRRIRVLGEAPVIPKSTKTDGTTKSLMGHKYKVINGYWHEVNDSDGSVSGAIDNQYTVNILNN